MMKKIIITCLMAFAILQASAQIWVEGAVSMNGDKRKVESVSIDQGGFNFMPTVGYDITDRLALAVALSYGHISYGTESYDNKSNAYGISPFVRYTFVQKDGLRFFVDGGLSLTRQAFKKGLGKYKEVDVFATPGLSYDINERVSIVGKLGKLGWMRNWYNGDVNNTQLELDLYTALSLGFIVKL